MTRCITEQNMKRTGYGTAWRYRSLAGYGTVKPNTILFSLSVTRLVFTPALTLKVKRPTTPQFHHAA